MMKKHVIIRAPHTALAFSLATALALSSCSSDDPTTTSTTENTEETGSSTGASTGGSTSNTPDTSTDVDIKASSNSSADDTFTNAVVIAFSGTSATVTGNVSGVTATVSGGVVSIVSTASNVNYQVSGTTTNGGLDISSTQPLMITLNGAGITRSAGAPINVSSAVATTVKSVAGSVNKLIDDSSNTASGALYTAGALNLVGAGMLVAKGNTGDAIHSVGNLTLRETALTIGSSVDDGIQTKGIFTMNSGTLTLTSTAEDVRGVNASASDIVVTGGTISMNISGAASKALRSKGNTSISGGTISLTTSGNAILEASGSGYAPSYSTAFKAGGDFTLSGGTITVTASGKGAKGISPDGNLMMAGGSYTFTSSGGAATYVDSTGVTDAYSSSAMSPDGACYLYGGTVNITATGVAGKGISPDGALVIGESTSSTGPTITVNTSGAKLYVSGSGNSADYSNAKAIKSDADVTINSGTINVTSTQDGGEGLESKATLTINGGTMTIKTVDDAINATSAINVKGGNIYCYATGNDAVDSNGPLTISGGLLVAISAASSPETGIDCDQNTLSITGGTVVALGGASHSSPMSSTTTQHTIHYGGLALSANAILAINNGATNLVSLKVPSLNYSSGALLYSGPSLASGVSYIIYKSGSYSGGSDFNGYYTGGSYTVGTAATTFTSSSIITTLGTTSGWRGR